MSDHFIFHKILKSFSPIEFKILAIEEMCSQYVRFMVIIRNAPSFYYLK